ncbi:MAG: hypothetical protein WD187_04305 [Candidatus Woykebacteria bacterium]
MDYNLSPGEVYMFAMVWFAGFVMLQATVLQALINKGPVALWFNWVASVMVIGSAVIVYPEIIPKLGSHQLDIVVATWMVAAVLLALVGIVNLWRIARIHNRTMT